MTTPTFPRGTRVRDPLTDEYGEVQGPSVDGWVHVWFDRDSEPSPVAADSVVEVQ